MSKLPPEKCKVVLANLKAIYDEIRRTKSLLDREDPQQLEAWGALDRAEAHLEGLPIYLGLITSDEICPHCDRVFPVPTTAYEQGAQITCPHCDRRWLLQRVLLPSATPRADDTWELVPDDDPVKAAKRVVDRVIEMTEDQDEPAKNSI